MALSFTSSATFLCTKPHNPMSQFSNLSPPRKLSLNVITKCESSSSENRSSELAVGSPVIVIEAPKMVKTAASMPCLRVNSGLIKEGDVGRIVSRKPKDVWAVRLSIGTYLLDGKYFKPLEIIE